MFSTGRISLLASLLLLGSSACSDKTSGDSACEGEACGGTDDSTPPDDSGTSNPDECATPTVTFVGVDGEEEDLTDAFTSGAYTTLADPGTINVCPGTWFARMLVRADINIVGLGKTPADTILSGGESGSIIDIERTNTEGPNMVLSVENVTLDRGANLDKKNHNSGGGGISCYVDDEDLGEEELGTVYIDVLADNVVFSNSVANDGPGLYGWWCGFDVKNSVFQGHKADDDGGAISMWFSTATFDGVTFSDNEALDGGALAVFYSDVTILNSTIENNLSHSFAGGIWVYISSIAISGSTFSGNINDTSDEKKYGGGLQVYGDATLTDVTFDGNSAPSGGGLFVYWDSIVEGTNCNFSTNTPDDIFVADYTEAGGVSMTVGEGYSFSCAENACTPN